MKWGKIHNVKLLQGINDFTKSFHVNFPNSEKIDPLDTNTINKRFDKPNFTHLLSVDGGLSQFHQKEFH